MTTDDQFLIAVRMAGNPPRNTSADNHIRCVYMNFSDFFLSYEFFLKEVARESKNLDVTECAQLLLKSIIK